MAMYMADLRAWAVSAMTLRSRRCNSSTDWAMRSTVSLSRPPLSWLASSAAANRAKFSLRSRCLASTSVRSRGLPRLYSATIWWNSALIGLGHCAARISSDWASDRPGAHRVGQHHHGVGQLVLDLLPVAVGHPPQQVPGHGGEEHGRPSRPSSGLSSSRSRRPTKVQRDGDQPGEQVVAQVAGRCAAGGGACRPGRARRAPRPGRSSRGRA